MRQDAFPLINERPESFDDFNGLRVAYSATGDERFVKAIINALDEVVQLNNSKNMSEADQVKDLRQRHKSGFIGSAVPFILVRDMFQHEQVNRLVRREAMTRSGPIKQVLENTIALFNGAVLKHSFPNRDGEFSALMKIASRESWEMIDNVRNFAPYTREMEKAKRGDVVSIMFFLSGLSLSQDLFEHVSVDLEVLNKDGGVIDGYSHKDVVVLKERVFRRFGSIEPSAVVSFRFPATGMSGKHRLVAVINDHIGKKKITLNKEVEVE